MIYSNPELQCIDDPIGFDAAIAQIQKSLAQIPYIDRVFGRAYVHKEMQAGKTVTIPKVYQGEGEYYNPLPNDNFKSSVFFIATGPEECRDYQPGFNDFTRSIALIFWGNLKAIDAGKDYIFLEEIKEDVLNAIKNSKSFKSYDGYIDERYNEVFKEFSSYISNMLRDNDSNEVNTQFLMYPYSGFRMNLTLTYTKEC